MTQSPSRLSFSATIAGALALLLSACQSMPQTDTAPTGNDWAATWASSPSLPMASGAAPRGMEAPVLEGTVRYFLRASAGGDKVRIAINGGPSVSRLAIGAATVALADGEAVDPSSLRPLTFSGSESFLLQSANAPLWSDPVDLDVPDGAVLAVSLYLTEPVSVPQADPQLVVHMAGDENQTNATRLSDASAFVARPLIAGVHVHNPETRRVVVAYGDSITDGMGSRDPLVRGWPDYLVQRLHREGFGGEVAVVNQGIGGNRLLQDSVGESALARFDRDVIAVPGVTDVIIMAGINDIGVSGLVMPGRTEPYRPLEASDIIAAYKQLIARAHASGIRAIGATLTPDLGSPFPGYATEEKDVIRNSVNDWIRNSGEFDAVIDFDAAIRDPARPSYMNPDYNSGDWIHPSDAGYEAMAEAIDLDLFR